MGLLDNMMTNPLAMASLGLLSMPTRSREPLNPIGFALQGAMGAQRMQQMQAQQKLQEQQFGMQQQEFALRQEEAKRLAGQRQMFDDYVASLTDPTQQQIARIAGPEAFGKYMIEQATPEAPQEFTRKEGDEIVTYRRDPKTLREVEVARAPRYKPAGTNVNVNTPGQMTSRPLTQEEVAAYGLTPEQAQSMMLDRFGQLTERPLAPGEKDRAKLDAEKEAAKPQAGQRLQMAEQKAKDVTQIIDKALGQTGWFTAGAGGAATGWVPGFTTKDLQENLKTIKANIGFDTLQAMRESSPTGGALGQVAVQELESLQAAVASLNPMQSPTQLKENLGRVKKHYDNWLRVMQQSYADKYGGQNPVRDSMEISPNQGGNVIDFNDL